MKIGISGASGNLGQGVLAHIKERDASVDLVGISRTPGNLGDGIESRHGDYDRPDTLATAYAGLDRLLLIPSSDLREGVRSSQSVAAIDAAVAAGVKHIVLMSAVGTRKQDEPAVGASYWTAEQHLIRNAPVWTIVRMSYYAEAFAQEALMSADSGLLTGLSENRVSYVSRDDVAATVAGVLIGEGHVGAIYSATGPQRLTSSERAAAATAFAGRQIGYVVLDEQTLRGGLAQAGLPAEVVNAIVAIQGDFAAGTFDIVTGDVERLSGRAPRALHEVLGALSSKGA